MSTTEQSKQDRLKAANEFIQVIAGCGHKYFLHEDSGVIARLDLDPDPEGKVWIIDEFTLKRVNTHKNNDWPGFNHGGGLRAFIQSVRDFIVSGSMMRAQYFTPTQPGESKNNYWGYEDEALLAVREAGIRLGLVTEPPTAVA
ncbi:hypothetical protein ABH908_000111 [Pseudomonas frederiksbergensis]|uniref:hypothetical protein n=1 Tax=Pseudomonas TaxID=286 RepID=UPI003D203012